MKLTINGTIHALDEGWSAEPLLWVLRELLGLVGTRYGCGVASCGACTVLVDGEPRQSCVMPAREAVGHEVITIEGLDRLPDRVGDRLRRAWHEERVPQCGFCQSGQLVACAALLTREPRPQPHVIRQAVAVQLCRCGTYERIVRAVRRAARAEP